MSQKSVNYTLNEWVKTKGIDNDKLSPGRLNEKLIEEVLEVIEASIFAEDNPTKDKLEHYTEEVLDVIQLMINRLRRIRKLCDKNMIDKDIVLDNSLLKHTSKKINRGWKVGEISYDIKIRDNS